MKIGINGSDIPRPDITIVGGGSGVVQLTLRATDVYGTTVAAPPAAFVSRSPNVATVDSAGQLTGRAAGVTLVVARAATSTRELSDSIVVTVACTASFGFGLGVQLIDSLTGGPLTSAADIYARDGTFADSVRAWPAGATWATAGERPGTYDITVRAAGYREWVRNGIVVGHDGCHVKFVAVVARLVRFSPGD